MELTGKGDCIERTSLSGVVNSVSGNSNNDSGVSNDYNLQLKSEPIGGPGTPDSLTELGGSSDDCAGCGQLIQVCVAVTITEIGLASAVFTPLPLRSSRAGSVLLERSGEAMACGVFAVLHVSPVAGG